MHSRDWKPNLSRSFPALPHHQIPSQQTSVKAQLHSGLAAFPDLSCRISPFLFLDILYDLVIVITAFLGLQSFLSG